MFFKKLIIGFIALFLFFNLALSYERPELKFRYVEVKKGDTFWKLFGEKWEIVSRINKIDRWCLGVGTNLKVPLDWELAREYPFFPKFLEQEKETPKLILVVIQEQFLAGYEFGELKFWYPICSGMEKGLTPKWLLKRLASIKKKKKERTEKERISRLSEGKEEALAALEKILAEWPEMVEYPTPRGRFKVLYKDLDHQSSIYPEPEGGLPMAFAIMFSWVGYGFHAFGIPEHLREWFAEMVKEKIGRPKEEVLAKLEKYSLDRMPGYPYSHGCIRLFIEDVQKLFEWAEIGTVVLIIDSFDELDLEK